MIRFADRGGLTGLQLWWLGPESVPGTGSLHPESPHPESPQPGSPQPGNRNHPNRETGITPTWITPTGKPELPQPGNRDHPNRMQKKMPICPFPPQVCNILAKKCQCVFISKGNGGNLLFPISSQSQSFSDCVTENAHTTTAVINIITAKNMRGTGPLVLLYEE